jgi:hypothetical protein
LEDQELEDQELEDNDMTGNRAVVMGIYSTRRSMERGIAALRTAGFSGADVSALFPADLDPADLDSPVVAQANSDRVQAGAVAGGTSGVALGGALGCLAGMIALAIPGAGPWMVAGPVLGALTGAGVGGVVGEVSGALIGMGASKAESKRYWSRLQRGEVLLSVHTRKVAESIDRAKHILAQTGAEDIIVTEEGRMVEPAEIRSDRDIA